ncbi:MAG TPA: S-layer homology domain-containing protein [Pseudobacteroides sp.]|uniref:S-layer homology domain-containing protein n=1 Tax=Pseudobacteroides sp. TaxID=1968840 RepID=UPI002F940462
MRKSMKAIVQFIIIIIISSCFVTSFGSTNDILDDAINNTAEYLLKTVKNPQVGSIGGEWVILGLSRSGFHVDDNYYNTYYDSLESYVKACNGVLHLKKYTEYSRVILALTSIGKDPAKVAGYNLLNALGDYEKTIWQGINGPVWALIALDSGNYEVPANSSAKTQATRDLYIQAILSKQLEDGGFNLSGTSSDPDITAMALQALSKYQNRSDVAAAIDKAIACLSKMQGEEGGYFSWGTSNSESVAQVIVALCELGISLDDQRFVKNGYTLFDNLMTYYIKKGGFLHTYSKEGLNQMATEQAFYALVAAQRMRDGKKSLYRMSEETASQGVHNGVAKVEKGLPDKSPDVKFMPLKASGKTFADISTHVNKPAIEDLAARGILNGKTDKDFVPDATMTRAEFATIVVKGLGLPTKSNNVFNDVPAGSWYISYVNTAYAYGIVNGTSVASFNPASTITREEAATMMARTAKLCGMDISADAGEIRDILAQFSDYVKSSNWAQSSLAFCYSKDILSSNDLAILPQKAIKRCEIAEMFYRMLEKANLL